MSFTSSSIRVSGRPERIYLCGMPGAGKTTAALWLAERLGWTFVDTDATVEGNTGESVEDIFRVHGEEAFRVHEQAALWQTLDLSQAVIATGGGTPCWFDNMEMMNRAGLTVYLASETEELCRRLRAAADIRPLFQGLKDSDLSLKLYEMLEHRRPFYTQCQLQLPVNWGLMDLYYAVIQLVR